MKPTSYQNLSASKGEFLEPSLSPKLNHSSGSELHSGFIAIVRAHPFSENDNKDPCNHLREFE